MLNIAAVAQSLAVLLIAAIPFPGQHSTHPKYWPAVHRWVTNYSPYSFDGNINALTSDGSGGVWFGISNTLEHIDHNGTMSQYEMPGWLWTVYGFTRDSSGRLWFSLGQSGRIGTLESNGRLHTAIVAPRHFYPDLRDIAFDSSGNLWFVDFGRHSVGVLTVSGVLREKPVTDIYYVHLRLENDQPYLVYYTPSSGELSAQMRRLSESRLQATGKFMPLQLGPSWLNKAPIGNTASIAATVTSPNGDVWLALNDGNATLAITRLSRNP